MKTIDVITRDGTMPLHIHMPAGEGSWPGVLMYMDGPGMRPAVHELAERLARAGYCVMLPDLFYRSGSYEPVDPKIVFTHPLLREQHRERFMALATPKAVMADTEAIFVAVDGLPGLAEGPMGVVGYCMGGRLALIAAGTFADRIAVAASYHGGGLANEAPTSPHLLAPKMRARVYVAGAIEDANFDDAQKQRLIEALSRAGVDYVVETYPAKHGWVPSDMPVHDEMEAEHHWHTLVPLMDGMLKA